MHFSFLWMSLSGFGVRVMLALQSELESVPSSSIFWKSLWSDGVFFLLKRMIEFTGEVIWAWHFFVSRFSMASVIFFFYL